MLMQLDPHAYVDQLFSAQENITLPWPKVLTVFPNRRAMGYALGGRGHVMSGALKPWYANYLLADGIRALFDLICRAYKPQYVVVCDSNRQKLVKRTLSVILDCTDEAGIPHAMANLGAVKKAWTGNGNASIEAIMDDCYRRSFDPLLEEEAMAIAAHHYGLTRIAKVRNEVFDDD